MLGATVCKEREQARCVAALCRCARNEFRRYVVFVRITAAEVRIYRFAALSSCPVAAAGDEAMIARSRSIMRKRSS